MPRQQIWKFKTVDMASEGIVVPAAQVGPFLYEYRINDMFKYRTSTGGGATLNPMAYLSELCTMYNYCKVVGFKIKVNFRGSATGWTTGVGGGTWAPAQPVRMGILCYNGTQTTFTNNSAGYTDLNEAMHSQANRKHMAWKYFGTPEHNTGGSLKKYWKIANFFSIKSEYLANSNYDMAISGSPPYVGSPVNILYAYVFVLGPNIAGLRAGDSYFYDIETTFYAKFFRSDLEIR